MTTKPRDKPKVIPPIKRINPIQYPPGKTTVEVKITKFIIFWENLIEAFIRAIEKEDEKKHAGHV
jgi:hypothetical protein